MTGIALASLVAFGGCGATTKTSTPLADPPVETASEAPATFLDQLIHEMLVLTGHEHPAVRAGAVLALGFIATADAPILARLHEALLDESMSVQNSAVLALGSVGTSDEATISLLLARLSTPDLQQSVYASLGSIGASEHGVAETLVEHLLRMPPDGQSEIATCMGWPGSPNPKRHSDPASALIRIGSSAVRPLTEQLGKGDVSDRKRVSCVLALIGKDALPQVLELIDDGDLLTRTASAFVLGCIEDSASLPGVSSALVGLLDDPASTVRAEAAASLASEGGCSADVVDGLAEALSDPVVAVRASAAASLFSCTRDGKDSIPILVKALGADDPGVRQASAIALGEIGDGTKKTIAALKKALEDQDPEVGLAASEALLSIAPGNKQAIKRLLSLCEHPDPLVREKASARVHLLGPHAGFAVGGLIKKLAGKPGAVKELASSFGPKDGKPEKPVSKDFVSDALVAIGASAVPPLVEWLKSGDEHEVDVALTLLARIGPDAQEATLSVMSLVDVADPLVRILRLHVLALIGNQDPVAVHFMVGMLGDHDTDVRIATISLLGDVSVDRVAVRNALEPHLADADPAIGIVVAVALWRLGGLSASHARELLAGPLLSSDCDVRRDAAEALGIIGAHRDLLEELIAAMDPASCPTDTSALNCLGDLGFEGRPAIFRLVEILEVQDHEAMAKLVARAIARIATPDRNPDAW